MMNNSFIPFISKTNSRLTLSSEDISIQSIEELIDNLRSDWELEARFVDDREKELNHQRQVVMKLAETLKTAQDSERQKLEMELICEKERQATLSKMLAQQQENLARRETRLKEYEKILETRQTQKQTPLLKADWVELDNNLDSKFDNVTHLFRQRWIPWVMILSATGLLITTGIFLFSKRYTSSHSSTVVVSESAIPEAVAALGYLEPAGEIINISASVFSQGAPRVQALRVRQGDYVRVGQTIAILDNRDRVQAQLWQAQHQVAIAQARLQQVKAGAKQGNIQAQSAQYQQTKAELEGQIAAQKATILSLKAQLAGEQQAQEATLERIEAELSNAQSECSRYGLLHENGAISVQEYDRVCLQAVTTQERLKEGQANLQRIITTLKSRIQEAQAHLDRTITTLQQQITEDQAMLASVREVRPVDVQVAQAELEAAKVAVKAAQADLELTSVKAPRNGQILKVHTYPGEMVEDKGIVELGETNQMYVTAEVYESDVMRIKEGQKATVTTDGVMEKLEGTVEEIGLQIDRQRVLGTDPTADVDARVVEVKIRLNPEDSKKVAQLTNLQVNVIIHTKTL